MVLEVKGGVKLLGKAQEPGEIVMQKIDICFFGTMYFMIQAIIDQSGGTRGR